MTVRSIAILVSVTAGLLVCPPAWAVSTHRDYGNAPAPGVRDKGTPEYNFSGNGFNFSISRPAHDAANDDDGQRLQGTRPQTDQSGDHSWFDRLRRKIEDLFRG